ncbi:hypothetical protein CBL_11001 [Carabus blaptoides fortunei]
MLINGHSLSQSGSNCISFSSFGRRHLRIQPEQTLVDLSLIHIGILSPEGGVPDVRCRKLIAFACGALRKRFKSLYVIIRGSILTWDIVHKSLGDLISLEYFSASVSLGAHLMIEAIVNCVGMHETVELFDEEI